jgi:hypothetical protein
VARNKYIVKREYDICRCLVTNIQSVTGHKTHEILSFMHSLAEECIEENGLKVDKYDNDVSCWETAIVKYAYYPNTKIYLGVSVVRHTDTGYDDDHNIANHTMTVKYKFYTPTTIKKLTQEQFDEIVIEAMLTDFSMDFDPPAIKKKKTLLEIKREEEEREARETVRLIKSLKQDLKEDLKDALLYKKEAVNESNTASSRKEYARLYRNAERNANHIIARLKELGDKTHEVLLTPTDSKNNQMEAKCQTKINQAVKFKL